MFLHIRRNNLFRFEVFGWQNHKAISAENYLIIWKFHVFGINNCHELKIIFNSTALSLRTEHLIIDYQSLTLL